MIPGTMMVRWFLVLCLGVPSVSRAADDGVWNHMKTSMSDAFDWTGFSIILGGVVGVALAQPQDFSHRAAWADYQRIPSSISRVGDLLGTGAWGISIAAAQYIWDRERSYSHAEALLFSFGTTSLLKFANGRTRPDSENRFSMPSGHTSTAFTTATHLAMNYGWKIGIPAYCLSTFVAATRWSDDAHWLSDTVAGAAIGIFWGRATSLHHTFGVTPVVERGTYGVQFFASY